MDQLKLVLEHKFWIIAGLALILPPIGWWAATDDLLKETDARNKKIAATEKEIVDPKEYPNDKWIKGAKEIESELSQSVIQSRERLYDHQKSAMILLPDIKNAFARCKLKYRGDGGTSQDFLEAKDIFAHEIDDDWKSAVNLIKPYKPRTGEGLVVISDDQTQDSPAISRHYEVAQWRQTLAFTSTQLWDVQEDIWFLRSLMKAIERVNQGTTEIGNSRIKKVLEATLRGGDPTDLKGREAGTVTSAANPNSKPAGMQVQFGGGGGGGGRAAGGSDANYKPPKPFDADDIFGDDGSKSNTNDPRNKRDAVGTEGKRYVEGGGAAKWRKRGFVLKLVMDEREIPTLLSALSESAFPVEIRDVEHTVHNPASDVARTPNYQQSTVNPDGAEFTPEQAAQQRKIAEGLAAAFKMHYLADVTVAGTMTIYDEPAASASKALAQPAPATQPGAARATASAAPLAKAAPRSAAAAKFAPTGSKSPAPAAGKNLPGTSAQPAKPPSSAAAAKTNPSGSKSPSAAK